MKNIHRQSRLLPLARRAAGFTLVELLVALAVFLVISAAAVTLVQQHVPLATTNQNQSALNLALGNAIAQMQSDVINAGSGYYTGVNQSDNPVGITIINCGDVTNGCTTTPGNDTLNVIVVDQGTPAAQPTDSTGSSTGCSASTNTSIYLKPPTGVTAATLAGDYHNGDYILLLNVNTSGNQFTTAQLTADGTTSGSMVQLQISATNSDGTAKSYGIGSTWSNDPFYITKDTTRLTTSFCSPTDWVVRLSPMITYSVDTSNSADPQLKRNGVVIADQIIGFKVGAMTWNTANNSDQSSYVFNAPELSPSAGCPVSQPGGCGFSNDWPLIRSVMISIIGRTAPNPTNSFRNSFDNGPYQVQAVSAVINPRNLSMRDNQ
jgi:prepilin-type N-terminal cleavage/methylation domain-containing protein